jgi:hypothetical protein
LVDACSLSAGLTQCPSRGTCARRGGLPARRAREGGANIKLISACDDQKGWLRSPPTKRSTGMARCETKATTTIYNISKGHGHPSSPSHPPLAWGEWGETSRHTRRNQTQKNQRAPALHVRELVARDGQASESRASTAIHSVGVWQPADRPSCHGMTAPLHRVHPSVDISASWHHCSEKQKHVLARGESEGVEKGRWALVWRHRLMLLHRAPYVPSVVVCHR